MSSRRAGLVVVLFASVVFALGAVASEARPAQRSGAVTISMLASSTNQPAFQVLIANFERVYPSIAVSVTYAPPAMVSQLEATELAAGNAPDLLSTFPGCGTTTSVCVLAKAGYLAAMVKAPWPKRSLPFVTSLSKYGQGLFVFEPQVTPYGVFTNDALFRTLGVKAPQTFSQLLDLCQKAKAAGTAALILDGASGSDVSSLIEDWRSRPCAGRTGTGPRS
jgi:raffinose/stachyose/melibiose transport system substrate-binding protein